MTTRPLLAKWRNKEGAPETWGWPIGQDLRGHTSSVVQWATFFLGDQSGIGRDLYTKMQLDEYLTFDEFKRVAILACLLHDVGKANNEFQRMLWTLEAIWKDCLRQNLDARATRARLADERVHQTLRHELAGVLFLTSPGPLQWLRQQAGKHARVVLAAVYGHHMKTDRQLSDRLAQLDPPTRESLEVRIPSSQVQEVLRAVIAEFRLPLDPFPMCADFRRPLMKTQEEFESTVLFQDVESRLSMGVKLFVVMADSFGSMSPGKGWPEGGDFGFTKWLQQGILEALAWRPVRLGPHIEKRAKTAPYSHQEEALRTLSDILVDVGCGGGKSATGFLAAVDGPKYTSSHRVIVTESVRAAAQQLFRDLGSTKIGKARKGSDLRFSTALTDKILLGMGEEEIEDPDDILDIRRTIAQYASDVVYTTVDQLLGAVSFRRKAVLWLPLAFRSTILFDEFHSYDPMLQANFRLFLKMFPRIRTVALSGTITPDQEREFLVARPGATIIRGSGGEEDLSRYQRYRFHLIPEEDAAQHFSSAHRTLWVVNRVRVAQDVGRTFGDALVLHSRFRHRERVLLADGLVKAFRSGKPLRAVTTQIAQTSLDISGGRGILEACSPAELLQRLGRLAERGKIPKGLTDVYIYFPQTSRPYKGNLLDLLPWYEALVQKPSWSFHELTVYFREAAGAQEIPDLSARPAMTTIPYLLRETDGKMTVILEQDIPEIKAALEASKVGRERPVTRLIQEYELSTYLRGWHKRDTFYGRIVAPEFEYDPRLGACPKGEDTE